MIASSLFVGTMVTIGFSIAPVISLGIGFCQFIIFFIKKITRDVVILDELAMNSEAIPIEIKSQFCTLVQNYCNVKELSPLKWKWKCVCMIQCLF